MDERSDGEKMDEVMLPGFRFHPTDEELVGFYLKRKIQQRPSSIELIKQLDIYKYDPWDLPKLATTGEKEWYFYCPRDRKYRNSARPNRVTGAGFWKATGTDRPIYSSEGSRCIGLKKSLVFYIGRAAKGTKTDWMMHEFRLPSLTDSMPPKSHIDRNIPANDSWAICRIFKKTNSTAQRGLSHSWVSPTLETTTTSQMLSQHAHNASQFSSEKTVFAPKSSTKPIQNCYNDHFLQQSSISSLPPLHLPLCKSMNQMTQISTIINDDLTTIYPLSPHERSIKCTVDASSFLLNMPSSRFGDSGKGSESFNYIGLQEQCNSLSSCSPQEIQENGGFGGATILIKDPNELAFGNQWGSIRSTGFPFDLPALSSGSGSTSDAWRSSLLWDSSPCLAEMSASYSTNKCYT